MKKTLLIILAVVLILVGGIWVYLMLFGAPESSDDFFADLGFGTNQAPPAFDVTPEPINTDVPEPIQETAIDTNAALNLITVRPTAGAVITGTNTAEQRVRYVEKGSGIIHEIDLQTNSDKIIDSTGTENTTHATWSSDGVFVVIESRDGDFTRNHLLEWVVTASTSGFESTQLPPDASQFGFSDDSATLYYTRTDSEGTLAYRYNTNTKEPTVWFSVPFIAANFEWGNVPLIYNRPGEGFAGFAYRYSNGELVSVGQGGNMLVGKIINDDIETVTVTENSVPISYIPDYSSIAFSFAVIPEKCAHYAEQSFLVCGYPNETTPGLPISWYKGEVALNDNLWVFSFDQEDTANIASLSSLSGQMIDVFYPSFDYTGSKLIFTDKSTSALWLYDTTK